MSGTNSNYKNQPTPQKYWRSDEYRAKVDPKSPNRINPATREALKRFLDIKRENPMARAGASDKPFAAGGSFSIEVPGIAHAHLNSDDSIVYRVHQGSLFLYGIYNHHDLGTGTPSNKRRQQNMARRFANMDFTEE